MFPTLVVRMEKWKFNKEYRVYVSTLGNFKDEHKRPLSVTITARGYCLIKTAVGYKLAHRLVLLTWRPIPNAEEMTVDHLNHNKRDNSLLNLEWVTEEENLQRALNDFYPKIQDKPKGKGEALFSFLYNETKYDNVGDLKKAVLTDLEQDGFFRDGTISAEEVAKKISNVVRNRKKQLKEMVKLSKVKCNGITFKIVAND